jgi:hypothetical protein
MQILFPARDWNKDGPQMKIDWFNPNMLIVFGIVNYYDYA